MRKYQQVALLAFALVSVCGLLLYRKQYVELRSTFEGFNIFGNFAKPPVYTGSNETLKFENKKFLVKSPTWINLHMGFYVYSAFWKGNGLSKAVGIGPKGVVPIFECHIWHDYRDVLFSNSGRFDFNEIKVVNSSFSVFEYSCDIGSQGILGSPYMFVFIINKEKRFVPISNTLEKGGHDNVATCVYPDYTGSSKVSIIEFIGYHQLIGFTDFVIYDEIHYGILLKVKEMVTASRWIKSFDVLPWHFPLEITDLSSKAALELDCFHRVPNKVSFVTMINFEDYIVPTVHNNIREVINKDAAIRKFKHQTCCSDYKNDRRSEKLWPLVLRKTHCVPSSESSQILINPKQDYSTPVSGSSLAVINSYKPCSKTEKLKVIYDSTARKFAGNLLQSKIILLWYSGFFF